MSAADVASPLLRVCAIVATPPVRFAPVEIVEIACADLTIGDRDQIRRTPRSQLFRPKSGLVPPADMIAGLTVVDLPPRGSHCTAEWLQEFFCECPLPDILVAHDAGGVRTVLNETVAAETPIWICTYRAARQLWRGASGYSLDDLISLRGLDNQIEALGSEQPPVRAVTRARLTRLLLVELLKQATVKQLISLSGTIAPPLRAPPLPDDDPAWSLMPDDDLSWWANEAINLPAYVRLRARAERNRRAEAAEQSYRVSLPRNPKAELGSAAGPALPED